MLSLSLFTVYFNLTENRENFLNGLSSILSATNITIYHLFRFHPRSKIFPSLFGSLFPLNYIYPNSIINKNKIPPLMSHLH